MGQSVNFTNLVVKFYMTVDMIHVYRNPETSEVSAETSSFKEALKEHPSLGATISCRGTDIAVATRDGRMWMLTNAGLDLLDAETETG